MEELTNTSEDIDGILHFQQSFALTLVFFVLTDEEKEPQTARMGSFVRRVTHRLTVSSLNKSLAHVTRIMVVPSSEAAVEALIHIADSLKPEKRQLKQAFYEQHRQAHYLPPTTPETERTAASHVVTALYEWSQTNQIPDREIDLVIRFCGSLETIVEHSVTGLSGAPISQRTKNLLQQFFHGDGDELIQEPCSFEELPDPQGNYMRNDGPTQPMYSPPAEEYAQQQHQQLQQHEPKAQPGINQAWREEPPGTLAAAYTTNQQQDWFNTPEPAPSTRQDQLYSAIQQQQPNYPNQSHPYHFGSIQQPQQQQQQQHMYPPQQQHMYPPQQHMYPSQQHMYPTNQAPQHHAYPQQSQQQQQQQQQQQPIQYPPTQYPPHLYR